MAPLTTHRKLGVLGMGTSFSCVSPSVPQKPWLKPVEFAESQVIRMKKYERKKNALQ